MCEKTNFNRREKLGAIDAAVEVDQFCNQTGPASLAAYSNTSAGVSVELVVKQQVVPHDSRMQFIKKNPPVGNSHLVPHYGTAEHGCHIVSSPDVGHRSEEFR